MESTELSRRGLLKGAAAGAATLTVLQVTGAPGALAQQVPGVVVPWLDQPPPVPPPAQAIIGRQLRWEELDSRITPNDEFFTVKHYEQPALSRTSYRLAVEGLVARPRMLTLAELSAMPSRDVEYTLECAGNHGLPFFTGGIGNAVWGGASLRQVLRAARPTQDATEVVFWGADSGSVTVRDDGGITGPGRTGTVEPDAGGGLDLTFREHFARSMSLEEALDPRNLLALTMNGTPLPGEHGAPVRLIAPGWYGVANVKWLTRVELTSQRYAGRFMARDYVTIREEQRAGGTVWTAQTVGHDRLKSAPAKVVRDGSRYTVVGAAWGAPLAGVEVSIDNGPWQRARLVRHRERSDVTWRFWTFDWGTPTAGEHSIRSRALAEDGAVQPTPDDPYLASRRTYWEQNGQITRRVRVTSP